MNYILQKQNGFCQVTVLTQWLGLSIKEAIDNRRLHHRLLPPLVDVERGFPQVNLTYNPALHVVSVLYLMQIKMSYKSNLVMHILGRADKIVTMTIGTYSSASIKQIFHHSLKLICRSRNCLPL